MKNFNMDFNERLVIETSKRQWIDSPSNGVRRIPLEREEAESGHTTSVVEYLPGTSFSEHSHPLGEEIFVLKGTFSDEKGDYPAGTYIRNPSGTSHSPFSKEGCHILVKLNQMDKDDQERVVLQTNISPWLPGHGGLKVMPLHNYNGAGTALVKWPAGERFLPHRHYGGEEIFVLSGEFIDEFGRYPEGSWIRSPHLSEHNPFVEKETIILVKTGHLPVLS